MRPPAIRRAYWPELGGGPPARQSRQIALKYALRSALGGTSKLRMNVLLAILRRRCVGRTNRPSRPIRSVYGFADSYARRIVTVPLRGGDIAPRMVSGLSESVS